MLLTQVSCWIGNREARDQIDFTAAGASLPATVLAACPDAFGIRVGPRGFGFVVRGPWDMGVNGTPAETLAMRLLLLLLDNPAQMRPRGGDAVPTGLEIHTSAIPFGPRAERGAARKSARKAASGVRLHPGAVVVGGTLALDCLWRLDGAAAAGVDLRRNHEALRDAVLATMPNAFGLRVGRHAVAAMAPETDWTGKCVPLGKLGFAIADVFSSLVPVRQPRRSTARLPWKFMVTGLPLFDTRLADIAEELGLSVDSAAVRAEHRRRTTT